LDEWDSHIGEVTLGWARSTDLLKRLLWRKRS